MGQADRRNRKRGMWQRGVEGRQTLQYSWLALYVSHKLAGELPLSDNFPVQIFLPAPFSETERSSRSGLRNADLRNGGGGSRKGLSQSRLRYSRAARTPRARCRFIRKSKKVARFTRCKAFRRHSRAHPAAMSLSLAPPDAVAFLLLARSLLFPRASNAFPTFLPSP